MNRRSYKDRVDEMSVQEYWSNIKKEAKYYISLGLNQYSQYLHKDGTIHDRCGPENFWEKKEEAQEFLDRCRGIWEFIDEKEMMVN